MSNLDNIEEQIKKEIVDAYKIAHDFIHLKSEKQEALTLDEQKLLSIAFLTLKNRNDFLTSEYNAYKSSTNAFIRETTKNLI